MRRQKIILYNPKAVFFDMPLALLAIGSALDARRYELMIIDGRLHADALPLVLKACDGALCLGVTALTGSPLGDALRISRAVKKQYPQLTIVWGGWHPSLFPIACLQDEKAIDVAVFGQGELTFKKLIEKLTEGGDMEKIAGLAYRTADGKIVKNPGRPLQDMNNLPPVNYELINLEAYFKRKKRRQLDYISSTGCRFRCTFCADPFVYKRGWTALDSERIGDELRYLKQKYGFTDVNFQDETFFTNRKRNRKIAEEFLNKNLQSTWAGTMRADQGFRMSAEEFDLCKKSGLRRVLVGVESGSQEMMDWLKKDIKIEQVFETAKRCQERDIGGIFPFIVGFPNETEASVEATLRLAERLNAMHPNFETPIFYFKPYPGSKITQEVVAQGYRLPGNLEEWAQFDYIGSSGPWVSAEKFKKIERFKFYNNLAWRNKPWWKTPLRQLARIRLAKSFFQFPLEKILAERISPKKQLS